MPGFGESLRSHRVQAGLTQADLAERAGISMRGLSDLERGARLAPLPETVRRLAQALKLDESATAELDRARGRTFARAANLVTFSPPDRSDSVDRDVTGRKTNTLPASVSSFVGRDADIADVIGAQKASRLVTLVGPGGCGKTRLALEVGARVMAAYADGAWLVDLAPLTDPTLVPFTALDPG